MKNKFEIRGMEVVIFITRYDGTILTALIDAEDLDLVSKFKGTWCAHYETKNNTFYTRGNITKGNFRTTISMHRWIMNPLKGGFVVDHINHNGLDNRRSKNLRILSVSENQLNRKGKAISNTSGAMNVYWRADTHKWQACFKHLGKIHHIGFYETVEDAELAAKEGRLRYVQKVFEEAYKNN